MGKPPTRSRKDLRTSAPYQRSKAPTPGAPLAKVALVPAAVAIAPAAVVVEPPPPAPVAIAEPPPPAAIAAPPTPPAHPERSDERSEERSRRTAPAVEPVAAPVFDFLAAVTTSLAFADAALAALPHPAELADGDPAAPAPPPGPAPAGDARSLRAGDQFALIYRHGAAVVIRRGTLGQRGAWRVVDYPSPALAAHAYALECSRLVDQGFRDVTTRSS